MQSYNTLGQCSNFINKKYQNRTVQNQIKEVYGQQNSRQLTLLKASSQDTSEAKTKRTILEAFFYGRSVSTVASNRMKDFLADTIADLSKLQAEVASGDGLTKVQDYAQQVQNQVTSFNIQTEVNEVLELIQQETESEMLSATGQEVGAFDVEAQLQFTPPDKEELVDNLRADIASARSTIRRINEGVAK